MAFYCLVALIMGLQIATACDGGDGSSEDAADEWLTTSACTCDMVCDGGDPVSDTTTSCRPDGESQLTIATITAQYCVFGLVTEAGCQADATTTCVCNCVYEGGSCVEKTTETEPGK